MRALAAASGCRASAATRPVAASRREPAAAPQPPAAAALPRRALLAGGAALLSQAGAPPSRAASSSEPPFVSAAGLLYYDAKVGDGEAAAAGDTVKILYSAHTVDADGNEQNVFDPYGSAGSSGGKGYKITLGGSDSDLEVMRGWELSILGAPGLPPMRAGGRRVVRIPPELAYGAEGHLCKRGVKTACEVPPNTSIQLETVLLGRSY